MLLSEYLDDIQQFISKLTVFTIHTTLNIDRRGQEQAHIIGSLLFANRSILHFREYIDTSEGQIDKVAYSYHFQDVHSTLLFRYDNAKHKPDLGFVEHKHCLNCVIFAPNPTIQQVVEEIMVTNKSSYVP